MAITLPTACRDAAPLDLEDVALASCRDATPLDLEDVAASSSRDFTGGSFIAYSVLDATPIDTGLSIGGGGILQVTLTGRLC